MVSSGEGEELNGHLKVVGGMLFKECCITCTVSRGYSDSKGRGIHKSYARCDWMNIETKRTDGGILRDGNKNGVIARRPCMSHRV